MATVTFDTLKFVETLKEAGVPERQAKAFSTAVQESHEAAELATKTDLREYESAIRGDLEKLETSLRHEMGELETGLRHEMKELELRIDTRFEKVHGEMLLMKWMLGLLIAGVASLVLKAFFGA
jgi:uncharacterized membrane protein